MDQISTKLIQERQNLVGKAEDIKTRAYEDNQRDLVDTEKSTLINIQERVRNIDAQLALTTTDLRLNDETASAIARFTGQPHVPDGGHSWRSAGDVLWDYIHQHDDREARERVRRFQGRAAEHMGTKAEVTVATAGGFGGLVVNPVTGPIIDTSWGGTPFLTLLGPLQAPGPLNFMRPRIVDPNLNDGAGPQAGGKEKAELPSKKFDVLADPVALATIGSYLNLSLQAEALVAGSLDLVVTQLNRRTARATEAAVVAEANKTTATVTLAAGADAATTLAAIYEAAALVFTNTSELPTWLVMGPQGWAQFGSLTDLAGRPIFPSIGAVNAPGTSTATAFDGNVAGLRTAVTPAITDTSMYMGNSVGLEAYIYRFPVLSAVEPSILGRQIAVAIAMGMYSATTTEAGPGGTPAALREGIVKIGP
jgi:HK97 family phage major capsid protein